MLCVAYHCFHWRNLQETGDFKAMDDIVEQRLLCLLTWVVESHTDDSDGTTPFVSAVVITLARPELKHKALAIFLFG